MFTTLVTMITSRSKHAPDQRSGIEMRDVLTRISRSDSTTLITFEGKTQEVEVMLSGAERIALIEGLGGTAT